MNNINLINPHNNAQSPMTGFRQGLKNIKEKFIESISRGVTTEKVICTALIGFSAGGLLILKQLKPRAIQEVYDLPSYIYKNDGEINPMKVLLACQIVVLIPIITLLFKKISHYIEERERRTAFQREEIERLAAFQVQLRQAVRRPLATNFSEATTAA